MLSFPVIHYKNSFLFWLQVQNYSDKKAEKKMKNTQKKNCLNQWLKERYQKIAN